MKTHRYKHRNTSSPIVRNRLRKMFKWSNPVIYKNEEYD